MDIINGYLSKAVEEEELFVGKGVSIANNYKRFLRILRRESHELSTLMPSDPAPKSAKYKYLYQVVRRKTRCNADESFNESVDDSFISEEQPS